jgi:uncharacterized membrane protein YgdD (TMEM256/DUF423 family)
MRIFGAIGAFSLLLSVAFGAFGAHALRDQLSERMREVFETGVRYQLIHSLAIVLISLLVQRSVLFQYAGWLYVAGIILFSFSLYMLAITQVRWLGMVTPFGGLCFIAGHAMLLAGFLRFQSS